MDWSAAKEETLQLWLDIRGKLPERDELELLTEINAVCALCEVADATESDKLGRCEKCLAYQQFGGCRGINAEMSERIVAKDWDGLETLVDEFIASLRTLELPNSA